MYSGHPWEGEDFGAIEYYWYLQRHYCFNVEFDVEMKPFLDFCKEKGHRIHQLIMKIATRLSVKHLPQRTVALNWKVYPTRYPAGYVRPLRKGSDMLEHVAIREREGQFVERSVRKNLQPFAHWVANRLPRLAVWLAKRIFTRLDVKNNYALMVSRNPLKNLGARVVFHGTHYRTLLLCIPYGDRTTVTFGAPHAFGNINYFEPFLKEFKGYMENPQSIPDELLAKPYKQLPLTD